MEAHDNGEYLRDIRIDGRARFTYGKHETLGTPKLTVRAYRRKRDGSAPLYYQRKNELEAMTATLIPYYAFANRGACEMQVWTYLK